MFPVISVLTGNLLFSLSSRLLFGYNKAIAGKAKIEEYERRIGE